MVPVDLKTVQELVRSKSVRLIDARMPEEFAIGRLPGAINIPWTPDAGEPSVPLDPQNPVVLYCGNEFCEQSLRLGEHLRKRGYRDLAVFVDGYEAWWNAGGSVDQD
jgi:rhodanese-related sulfurtransferase